MFINRVKIIFKSDTGGWMLRGAIYYFQHSAPWCMVLGLSPQPYHMVWKVLRSRGSVAAVQQLASSLGDTRGRTQLGRQQLPLPFSQMDMNCRSVTFFHQSQSFNVTLEFLVYSMRFYLITNLSPPSKAKVTCDRTSSLNIIFKKSGQV